MAHKCPACQADVPDVVLQSKMTERVDAKTAEIVLLQTSLTANKDKADRFDAVETERVRLAAEVVQLNEGATRTSALQAVGVTDAAVSAGFQALYASYAAGIPDGGETKSFTDWVNAEDGAKANPLLSSQFGNAAPAAAVGAPSAIGAPAAAAAVGQPATAPPAGAPPVGGLPAVNNGAPAQPPAGQNLMSAAQLKTMFQGMNPGEVKAWQQQHGAAYGWNPPAAPPAST